MSTKVYGVFADGRKVNHASMTLQLAKRILNTEREAYTKMGFEIEEYTEGIGFKATGLSGIDKSKTKTVYVEVKEI